MTIVLNPRVLKYLHWETRINSWKTLRQGTANFSFFGGEGGSVSQSLDVVVVINIWILSFLHMKFSSLWRTRRRVVWDTPMSTAIAKILVEGATTNLHNTNSFVFYIRTARRCPLPLIEIVNEPTFLQSFINTGENRIAWKVMNQKVPIIQP